MGHSCSSNFEYTTNYDLLLILLQLVEGKADIEVTTDELVNLIPYPRYTLTDLRYHTVVVVANVTEAATGITLSGNSTVDCTSTKYQLSFLDITPTSFKPGLSVSAYVRTNDRWLFKSKQNTVQLLFLIISTSVL